MRATQHGMRLDALSLVTRASRRIHREPFRVTILCCIIASLFLLAACSSATHAITGAGHSSSTPTSTPTSTPPAATATIPPDPTQSAPSLAGWNLEWDAEFSGTTLDTTKWQALDTGVPATIGCCAQYADQDWSPANVSVESGALHLITTNQRSNGYPYTSGAVSSLGKYSFQYGRVDIRAKLPTTEGLWPAVWLLPTTGNTSESAAYEIDLIEAWGSQPTTAHFFFHWQSSQIACEADGPNFTTSFHTFTFIWSKTVIEWLVDGKVDCVATSHIPQTPMYLILSAAINGSLERTNASTVLPQSFDIDYIRIWSHA